MSEKTVQQRTAPRSTPPLPSNILHHRLDLIQPHSIISKEDLCSYQNNIATLCKTQFVLSSERTSTNVASVDLIYEQTLDLIYNLHSYRSGVSVAVVLQVPDGAVGTPGDWFGRDRSKLHGLHKRYNETAYESGSAFVSSIGRCHAGPDIGSFQGTPRRQSLS